VRSRGRVACIATVAVLAIAMTACSNGTSVTTPFVTTAPALHHGPQYEVTTGAVTGLGKVLVDGQGLTLYMFHNDVQGKPSRCYNICSVQWPPLVLPTGVTRPLAGPGISSTLLGTSTDSSGTTQVTYNGWPLYVWPPDRSPGMATGQALTNAGGLWYVLSPAGKPIVTPAA
jgi:predicted lipoprotein with Yx(FWY)xxD motif